MKDLKHVKHFNEATENLNISDVIVRFLNSKAIDLNMDVKDIRIGIEHAGHLGMDRLYILDKEGNRLDSLDINEL